MNRREFIAGSSTLLLVGCHNAPQVKKLKALASTHGIMTLVPTRGYNNQRTGCNLSETVFTIAGIKQKGISRRGTLQLTGDKVGMEAQTLIAPSVTCSDGVTRDLAICASMSNSVFAFDANNPGLPIWQTLVGTPINGSTQIDGYLINNHWGIISTPVYDPDTKRLYLCAWISPSGIALDANYYVFALDCTSGKIIGPGVQLEGTSNGQNFLSMMRKQRASLTLVNNDGVKTVFIPVGTVAETSNGAAGYIFAYDVASAMITSVLALTKGDGAGIWMGGSGLAVDSSNNLYAMTGNGGFDGKTDFGESFIGVTYQNKTLSVAGHWTPYTDSQREGLTADAKAVKPDYKNLAGQSAPSMPVNMASMQKIGKTIGHFTSTKPDAASLAGWSDEDLGSGGIVLDLASGVLIGAGKDGLVYGVRILPNMGNTQLSDLSSATGIAANYSRLAFPVEWFTYFPGYNVDPSPTDASTLDFLYDGKTRHEHATPIIAPHPTLGKIVICWGENTVIRVWQLATNGQELNYVAQGEDIASYQIVNSPGGMPGGFMSYSTNNGEPGTGLIWATFPMGDANKTITKGVLVIYDGENFPNGQVQKLWDSRDWGWNFDYNKFNPLVVSGGKAFLPTYDDNVMWLGY